MQILIAAAAFGVMILCALAVLAGALRGRGYTPPLIVAALMLGVIVGLAVSGGAFDRAEDTAAAVRSTPEPAATAAPTATPEAVNAYTIQDYADYLEQAIIAPNYEDYRIVVEDDIIGIFVCPEGVAADIIAAAKGNAEAQKQWQIAVELCKSVTSRARDMALELDVDAHVSFWFENEANRDNVILTVVDGVVFYDVLQDPDFLDNLP